MKNILNYYQEEITFLREKGKKFALKYPAIADKINFDGNRSNDPHTERIIESFAFMVAQINAKIDYNAEDLAYYLLTGLYPGITAVFPPCSVVQFDGADYGVLPRNSRLRVSIVQDDTIQGEFSDSCFFRTIYPLTLYPLEITKLSVTDTGEIKIDIKTKSVPVEEMQLSELVFYIDASLIDNAFALYTALFAITPHVFLLINSKQYELRDSIELCGFSEDETAVPVPKFVNYSFYLLREVLLFPQKFMFFKIKGIDKIIHQQSIKDVDCFSICIRLSKTDIKINENSIKINAVPAVNLFDYVTNSFRFDNTKSRYLLLSNNNPYIAIHSIKEMHLIDSKSKEDHIIPQYFSFDYAFLDNSVDSVYWFQPFDIDNSTYVSFVDTHLNPTTIYSDVAYAKTLCINKIDPRSIRSSTTVFADYASSPNVTGKLLLQPTSPVYIERRDIWNLLNQLAFGQLSKNNAEQLVNKLQHIVTLYSGTYAKLAQTVFDSILKTEVFESNRRITVNGKSSFVKSYTYAITVKNRQLYPYTTLFFKVFEMYLRNNKPINSYINLKIVDQ